MTNISKMIRLVLAVVSAGIAVGTQAAPNKGSCATSAEAITFTSQVQSKAIHLTSAYIELTDRDGKDVSYYDKTNQVWFLKATLKRGKEYSLWLKRGESDTIAFYDIYPREAGEEEIEPGANFLEYSGKWATAQGFDAMEVLTAEEWTIDPEDPEMSDPESWTYYFHIYGAEGSTATLQFVEKNALPIGIEENPVQINVTGSEQKTIERAFVIGEYAFCYATEFISGRRYLFATMGGSDMNPYDVSFGTDGKVTPYPEWDEEVGNTSYSFDPSIDGIANIIVSESLDDTAAKFRLRYRILPTRTIAEHDSTPIAVGEKSAAFQPGRINATNNAFYDLIIDQQLFKVTLEKGVNYVAETAGATTNVLINVYNSSGRIIETSTTCGDGSFNARVGFVPSATGTYYVGIAQNLKDDDLDKLNETNVNVTFSIEAVELEDLPAETLAVKLGTAKADPREIDTVGSTIASFDRTHWTNSYTFPARAGLTYALQVKPVDGNADLETRLTARASLRTGKTTKTLPTGGDLNATAVEPLTVSVKDDGLCTLVIATQGTSGLDYPEYTVHIVAYGTESRDASDVGMLFVKTKGLSDPTYLLNGVIYPANLAIPVLKGTYTVRPTTDKMFNVSPTQWSVTVVGEKTHENLFIYRDKADPKDDTASGATSWTLKNKDTTFGRTLWTDDKTDYYSIAGKDGQYYTFWLDQEVEKDAIFSILDPSSGYIVQNVTRADKILLPTSKSKYLLVVQHQDAKKPLDTSYTLHGYFANVGTFKFAKTAVSVKENAGYVSLTVNRSAKDGMVKIDYATEDGTAVAGQNYEAQSGTLEWADGDNKAKTIRIKLIPDIVSYYHTVPRTFKVRLTDGQGDYPAVIQAGQDVATVTLTETAKAQNTTIESAYKPIVPKSVKTEEVDESVGTFFGVLKGVNDAASVTLTSTSSKGKEALTAKVQYAGKSYSFKTDSKNPQPWSSVNETTKTLELTTKDGTLHVTILTGKTTTEANVYLGAEAQVSYTPAVGEEMSGTAYRNNAKIDAYLKDLVAFAGYYTVALEPRDREGNVLNPGDLPAGIGYLTLTVGTDGKMKVAGKLADGTSVSLSSIAAVLRESASSATGTTLTVPLYAGKAGFTFAGELVFTASAAVNGDGRHTVVLDTATSALLWKNTATTLSFANDKALDLRLDAIGGFYDQVERVQRHYLERGYDRFAVDTVSVDEMPLQLFTIGKQTYAERVVTQQADGYAVDLSVDAVQIDKKKIVKGSDKMTDFKDSTNPANVQVKIARATGLVTGGFSVWARGEDAKGKTIEKEISGFKHFGVLLLARNAAPAGSNLDEQTLTAGFFTQNVTVPNGTSTRKWLYSAPFSITAQ